MAAEILEGPVYLDDSHHSENVRRMRRIGDEIAELSAHLAAETRRMLTLIREFDKGGGWEDFRSCAHWLSWRAGLNLGAAREHVRAITRVATSENEEKLLGVARGGTATHVERIVRAWRRATGSKERDEADRQHRKRYLQTYTDEDGMLVSLGLRCRRYVRRTAAVVSKEVQQQLPVHSQLHSRRPKRELGERLLG